jgi:hypothetical protein
MTSRFCLVLVLRLGLGGAAPCARRYRPTRGDLDAKSRKQMEEYYASNRFASCGC